MMTRPNSDIYGHTILIADDIPANLAIAVDYLESSGFKVMVAQDGEEALERAKLILPDLILLDVMMPGIDGFETCRRLKMIESTRDIPVIFMTALLETKDMVAGFAAGGVDYVTKPFQAEELLARITLHLTLQASKRQVLKQNEQLLVSETRYRRLFETAKDGILLLDFKSGRITDVNAALINMLGYSRDHYLKQKLCEVLPFKDNPACHVACTELQTKADVSFEHWPLAASDKSLVDVQFVGNVYQVNGSRIVQCNIRNITCRIQDQARIRYMALHDALTGLPNRILLQDHLIQAIALASRNRQRIAVLMLDLDHFKNINDSLGHHIGDRLLQAVSARLRSCLRESDIVARLGGDEFVIALPETSNSVGVEIVVQKLLASLLECFQIDGHELRVSGSIGIAEYPDDGENPALLLRAADTAMYAAKVKGNGNFQFFTPELNVASQRRLLLVNDLLQAFQSGQFMLHYQPQISTHTGIIIGVEALLRWNHPVLGSISPTEFIPLLEEMGLISDVGKWVLRTACLQSVAWQKEGLSPIRMAVNVSAQQLYRGNLPNAVGEALQETGLDPKWLELEMTETLTLDDSETTINIMQRLKQIGVSLSLDDFGTGWSSLSYLTRFPLDRIKIDRSFMREFLSEPAAEAVVASIIDLARNLGLTCVAEGVETVAQLEYLESKRCAEFQGFLYSPALPAEECGELIRQKQLDWIDSLVP